MVKKSTSDDVIDTSKKMFYEQRVKVAKEIQQDVKKWADDSSADRKAFREKLQLKVQRERGTEGASRAAKKALMAEKARSAADLRKAKAEGMQTHREKEERHMAMTKNVVNSSSANTFVDTSLARRMLQHPHYAEVSAVVTDVTSTISKDIAAAPRRRPPSAGAASGGAKPAAALRMSPSSTARKT